MLTTTTKLHEAPQHPICVHPGQAVLGETFAKFACKAAAHAEA